MLMPEAAIGENRSSVAREDKVRFAGQVFGMQPVAQACGMQRPPDRHLRFSMATFDRCHISTAGRNIMNIHHDSGSFAKLRSFNQRCNMRQHDAGNLPEDWYRD